jgi:hypothetical protein
MQKRLVTIVMGCESRLLSSNLFRKLDIPPFVSQYILSLKLFVVKNKNHFTVNSENCTNGTRQLNNFYHPVTNFAAHQSAVHYMDIKIFHNFPPIH